jgi:CTP:molybdopterin cytidylyltransferase MocA
MVSEPERGERVESAERGSLWAVVLAGGEGTRLRPLVRHLCGDERPKQFSPLLGARTLLRQTLDRVGLLIPLERTVVVTLQAHARYLERELGEKPRPLVLNQPESRGTAAGILPRSGSRRGIRMRRSCAFRRIISCWKRPPSWSTWWSWPHS